MGLLVNLIRLPNNSMLTLNSNNNGYFSLMKHMYSHIHKAENHQIDSQEFGHRYLVRPNAGKNNNTN